jgi:hypothetical protein
MFYFSGKREQYSLSVDVIFKQVLWTWYIVAFVRLVLDFILMLHLWCLWHPLNFFKCQASEKSSSWTAWPLNMEPIGCLETLINNYQCTLCNIPVKRWYYTAVEAWKYAWIWFSTVRGLSLPECLTGKEKGTSTYCISILFLNVQ